MVLVFVPTLLILIGGKMTTLKDLDGCKVAVSMPGMDRVFQTIGKTEGSKFYLVLADCDSAKLFLGDGEFFDEELIKPDENHGCDYYIDLDARHG